MKRSPKIIFESMLHPILADNEPPTEKSIIKKDTSKAVSLKILAEDIPRTRITESSPRRIRQVCAEEKIIKEKRIKKSKDSNKNFIRLKK